MSQESQEFTSVQYVQPKGIFSMMRRAYQSMRDAVSDFLYLLVL